MIVKEGLKLSDVFKNSVEIIPFGKSGFVLVDNDVIILSTRTDSRGIVNNFTIGEKISGFGRSKINDLLIQDIRSKEITEILNFFGIDYNNFKHKYPEYFI